MNHKQQTIEEAIAYIASASEILEKHCNTALKLLERIELDELDADLRQDKPEEHNCSGCMDCLGLSWRDFL